MCKTSGGGQLSTHTECVLSSLLPPMKSICGNAFFSYAGITTKIATIAETTAAAKTTTMATKEAIIMQCFVARQLAKATVATCNHYKQNRKRSKHFRQLHKRRPDSKSNHYSKSTNYRKCQTQQPWWSTSPHTTLPLSFITSFQLARILFICLSTRVVSTNLEKKIYILLVYLKIANYI